YEYEISFMISKGLLSEKAVRKWPSDDKLTESESPENFKIKLYNPAFDTTPSKYINRIILDIGVFTPSQIKGLNWHDINGKISEVTGRELLI
ncbi:MAG: hypothetical protein QW739_01200, partial [Candidatus Odinarchaeota archaeon]